MYSSILEEFLIISPKIDEFLPNMSWNLDQTPSQHHLMIKNPLLHSPDDLLLGRSSSSCFFYDDDDAFTDLPPITMPPARQELFPSFLDQMINDDDVMTNININAAPKMSKSKNKKADGQPSKNLMAERRRRKRLNDRLSMLRSIVPKITKMDRTSILGDTIDYMKELLDKIRNFEEDDDDLLGMIINNGTDHYNLMKKKKKKIKDINNNPNDTQVMTRNPPKFDVERRNQYNTNVDVCCAAKPGLLLSTLTTLDALGLDIQQCVISCFNDFSFKASCFEVAEHRSLVSSEDVKLALFQNAGYGRR